MVVTSSVLCRSACGWLTALPGARTHKPGLLDPAFSWSVVHSIQAGKPKIADSRCVPQCMARPCVARQRSEIVERESCNNVLGL